MKNLAEKYQINHVHTTPYRPQGNGLAERTIRKLLNVLRMSISEDETNWDKCLRMAQNLLNTTVNSSIKRTPFQALYGQCPRLTFESPEYSSEKDEDPIRIQINNAELMRENLRTKLEESNLIMKTKQHKKAKEREFQVDDLVYVQRYVLGGANYKLCPKFEGPYKITQKLSKRKYMVKHFVNGKEKKCHVDRRKCLHLTRVGN